MTSEFNARLRSKDVERVDLDHENEHENVFQEAALVQERPSEDVMSRKCSICDKGPQYGNRVSHAHNLSRHRWMPNLQKIKYEQNGKVRRGYVCTRCLRTGDVKKVV